MTEHTSPCQILQDCSTETKDRLDNIDKDLKELMDMKDDIAEMAKTMNKMSDILMAWNNVTGFALTVKFLVKATVILSIFTGAIYTAMNHFKI